MKKILIAFSLVVGIFLTSFALADEPAMCKTHLGQVLSDLAQMKADPGWEGTIVQPFDEERIIQGIGEVFIAMSTAQIDPTTAEKVRTDSRLLLAVTHPEKPGALLIWFNQSNCFIAWGSIPKKTYDRAVLTLQRGA